MLGKDMNTSNTNPKEPVTMTRTEAHQTLSKCTNMEPHLVTVIDGPTPASLSHCANMEPHLVTESEHLHVRRELMQCEPLFHRPEFGTTRKDFEKMTAPTFWEVGASGRRFSRKFVLDALEKRFERSTEDVWEIGDFHCLEIAADNYLVTYTLIQGARVTQRATI